MRATSNGSTAMELSLKVRIVTDNAPRHWGEFSMPKSQLVAQHVPYLRRYARALTGSQASGDSYVVAALEALVKDQSVLDDSLNPKVALFRLFSKIWNSVPVNAIPNPVVNLAPAERHLGHISALPRQAFLLI